MTTVFTILAFLGFSERAVVFDIEGAARAMKNGNAAAAALLFDQEPAPAQKACLEAALRKMNGEETLGFDSSCLSADQKGFLLLLALRLKNIEEAKAYIAAEANLNAKDMDGWTPLHFATAIGRDLTELLLKKGADPNAEDNMGYMPLHVTAIGGTKEVAEILLEYGADLNAKSGDGLRPIYLAILFSNNDLIELFLEHGAVYSNEELIAAEKTTPVL